MTTEAELVTGKNLERITQSGLLGANEQVIAYANGLRLPPVADDFKAITSTLKMILTALANQYRPSSWRAVVLTDRQLYICSLRGGRPGKLKTVLARHPRSSYAASIADSNRSTMLTVEGLDISCPSTGRMRRSADMTVAAGEGGAGAGV